MVTLTETEIALLQRALQQIASGPGFGKVTIVIEKGIPRRIEITQSHAFEVEMHRQNDS